MEIQILTEGCLFHIYNRGVNGEVLFKEERNYYYFLKQYAHYCTDVFETYAFALLKNHFHLLVRVKQAKEIIRDDGKGTMLLNSSKQLSHFFNSYAQSINKTVKRTGPLFESPFKRKLIEEDTYITNLICYCHYNPQLHGFVNDFKDWNFTSYHTILNATDNFLESEKVLEWFGGKHAFEKAHANRYNQEDIEQLIIE